MIKSIHVYSDGDASAKLECQDNTTVEITLPAEGLKGIPFEKRIDMILARANNYLKVNCGGCPDTLNK